MAATGIGLIANHVAGQGSKSQNSTLILTHNSTNSTTLSNTQPTTNLSVQTANIAETVNNATTLTQTTPTALSTVAEKKANIAETVNNATVVKQNVSEALTPVTEKTSNKIVKHGNVHMEHTHTSNAQSTVYIIAGTVATLLLIAVGILVLKMAKPNKQDVFTDMQQYYTDGNLNTNLAMPSIYPNTSVYRHKF